MKCPDCGYKNDDDGTFCISCGIDMRIRRNSTDEEEQCPKCGAMNELGSGRCSSCGARIESKFLVCPNCGATNLASERFCVKCDFEFTKPAPEPVAPPRPESAPLPTSHGLRCPKCSGPLDPGIVFIPNAGPLSGLRWDTVDGIDWWGTKGEILIEGDIMVQSIRTPGFRCPACRVLVVTY